jgi:DNA-binding transcriptional MerR regulator
MSIALPEKHYYTIGDVSRLTGTKPHILRYWESQFKLLRPARRYSGHRKFTQRDIDLVNKIRFLILDKKYTLAGAKREINRQYAPTGEQKNGRRKVSGGAPHSHRVEKRTG